jgi:hypothetical protein
MISICHTLQILFPYKGSICLRCYCIYFCEEKKYKDNANTSVSDNASTFAFAYTTNIFHDL